MIRTAVVAGIVFALSLFAAGAVAFGQTSTSTPSPSPTSSVSPTTSVTPSPSSTVPSGAPATGRGL